MTRNVLGRVTGYVVGISLTLSAPAYAQEESGSATVGAAADAAQAQSATGATTKPSGTRAFVSDVLHDYANLFTTRENAELAAGGVILSATTHFQDHKWSQELSPSVTPTALAPGATYGNLAFQFPLAITWWIVGHAAGSDNSADAGRDLLRVQILSSSWAYALKYAVNRTRPNGDPRSFPSGHATAAFATATVLQEHYGWKLGLPMYAAAAYVAAERVTQQKHWPSDVVAGATLGTICGRTVTLHVRRARLNVQPQAVPRGGAVIVHVQP
jgi:membrane-associated phospholipid phosphatase